MADKITLMGELEFSGTVRQFEELAGVLEQFGVTIRFPGGRGPGTAGIKEVVPGKFLTPALVKRLTEGRPLIRVPEGIAGGIRNMHLHVGRQIALLDKAGFREVARAAAAEAAERITSQGDLVHGIGALEQTVGR